LDRHAAVSLASSFALENDCDSSAGCPATAAMLFSASIVNLDIDFLLLPLLVTGLHIHHSGSEKHQAESWRSGEKEGINRRVGSLFYRADKTGATSRGMGEV
jgi:hypothetical protein